MKKRIITLLLCIAVFALLCAGCKTANEPDVTTAPPETTGEAPTTEQPTETAAPAETSEQPSEQATEPPTEQPTKQASEQQPEQTADAPANTSLPDAYQQTLSQYLTERNQKLEEMGYSPLELDTFYYCVKDINGDGTAELAISEDGSSVAALYTTDQNEAVNLFFPERHGHYEIQADGTIAWDYKECIVYRLNGAALETILDIDDYQSIDESAWSQHCDEIKTENGISTETMRFDFVEWPA